MAKVHRYHLYVRRSNKFKWTLVQRDIKKPIERVKEMGELYLKDKYHDRGEFLIFDNLIGKYVYKHVRRPKILS